MIRKFIRERTLEQSMAIAMALLVLVLIGATMFVAHNRVAGTLHSSMVNSGESVARSIGAVATPSLLAYNYAALQNAAEASAEDPGVVYVVIQDKEGNPAGVAGRTSFWEPGFNMENIRTRDSIHRDLVLSGDGIEAETVVEVAVPVLVEDVEQPWGTVRVGMSCAGMDSELGSLRVRLFVLGACLALGATLLARWVARQITAPLRRLSVATEAVSVGKMDQRIPVGGSRELSEVTRAFNRMVERVREKAMESEEFQRALEALNSTLEEQVKERTRALQESEAQYKTLVEHSPDSILIVQQGRIVFRNRAFMETFQVPDEELDSPDFTLGRIFERSSSVLARGRMEAWEQGRSPSPVEVLGKDGSGNIRSLELRGSRIEYRGRPAAECLLVDTTEMKRLREHLVDTERLRALGELASGVAHDFNNLLSAILGRIQLLRRRGFDIETDREMAVIEKAASDGRETVRRIQEFARMRQDREFSPVDLSEIIQDALEMTSTRWKDDAVRRNVKITVETDIPSVPPIMGKDSELREVFTNLILNASDAMPRGGRLRVSCEQAENRVIARIEDTGVGMTQEIRRHLFDPFFTTKGQAGTGLGLSMVYGIVTRHEGRIDVSTDLGKGTTFTLEFPLADEIDTAIGADGGERPELSRPGRILVIDDEPGIVDVLRDALESEGHSVETATRGADGVKMVGLSEFDLVFTDLGMPDMSGWEVATRVREQVPEIPVVLVTGWGAALDDEEVRDHSISAVVHKPFDLDDLLQTTTSVLLRSGRCGRQADGDSGSEPL